VDEFSFATFLASAFPEHADLQPDCWLHRAIASNYDGRGVGEAARVVAASPMADAAIRRLRLEHPLDRGHRAEHDTHLVLAFTEFEAFAWAVEIAGLPPPEFMVAEGAPDLRSAPAPWIEAKTIRNSDDDREAWDVARLEAAERGDAPYREGVGASAGALIRKFDDQLADSMAKWKSVGGDGALVTFFCLAQLDAGVDPDEADALITEWALTNATPTSRIVVIRNHSWDSPLVDTLKS